ncbi:CorA family divalent cation transporter [Pseudomarimonas arenosa]|uniref:Magnesium transporter n=1 Tax=Pseudomarimonas arenosa TaxID=2774145 RepID=A0AAW3ZRT2_9GAMM|nr:hypothetical protein [Pseudomarimonas arenosa]
MQNELASGVVNCVAYDRKQQVGQAIALDAISDAVAKPDTFVWVGLHEPSEALLDQLQEEFDLHELAVEDAHHAHQRPKIEAYGNSLFIALHTAQMVEGHIQFGETHVFVPLSNSKWVTENFGLTPTASVLSSAG